MVSSSFKLFVGLSGLALISAVWAVLLIFLLPSRVARIKACNYYGRVAGRFCFWSTGCSLSVEGRQYLDPGRPAIYVSNHTSIVDIFLGMWQSPVGSVGVAKKEVVYYPFLGQLYLLSGHLRIDRSHSDRAVESLRRLATIVKRHKLSIFIWPEGTRSRDGRLLPFKKGLVHLAQQTGLPVVPLVVLGAHRCWERASLKIHGVPVHIKVLPPIDVSHWSLERADDLLEEVRQRFLDVLPADQLPLAKEAAA